MIDIGRVSGEGLGARYEQGVRGLLGRRIAADYEITVHDPNRRIEFRTIAGPARPHGVYEFAEADGGTRLTFSLEAKISGLRGLFMGSAVQRTMESEVRTIDNLKQALETPAD